VDEKLQVVGDIFRDLEALLGHSNLCSQEPVPSPARRQGSLHLIKAAVREKASDKENVEPASSAPGGASGSLTGPGAPAKAPALAAANAAPPPVSPGGVVECTPGCDTNDGPHATPARATAQATPASDIGPDSVDPAAYFAQREKEQRGAARDSGRRPGGPRKRASPAPPAGSRGQRASLAAKATPAAAPVETPSATPVAQPQAEPTSPTPGRRGSARRVTWTCGACTFENEPAKKKCGMCSAPRGASTAPREVIAAQRHTPAGAGAKRDRAEGGAEDPQSAGKRARAAPAHTGLVGRNRAGAAPAEARADSPPARQGKANPAPIVAESQGRRRSTIAFGTDGAIDALVDLAGHGGAGDATGGTASEGAQGAGKGAGKGRKAAASQAGREKDGGSPAAGGKKARGGKKGGAEDAATWAGARRWLVTHSGLGAREKRELEALGRAAGFKVVPEWQDGVTHVVCGTQGGVARRTAKLVLGLQAGAAVVGTEWIRAGREARAAGGGPPDEVPFLVPADSDGAVGAATRARGGRAPEVLGGVSVHVLGKFSTGAVMHRNVGALVAGAGGAVTARPPSGGSPDVVVLCDPGNLGARELSAAKRMRESGVEVVGYKWLLECVVEGRRVDAAAFRLV